MVKKSDNLEVENLIQFSSARKYSAVEFKDYGAFALGAPEYLTADEAILEIKKIMLQKVYVF